MTNFEELQSLWNRQSSGPLGTAHDAIAQARRYERSLARKLTFAIISLCATVIFILIIWLSYRFESVLTHVGLTIVVATVSVFTIIYLREYLYLRHDRSMADSIGYLSHLKTYYRRRRTTMLAVNSIYTTMLSAGIFLYMYSLLRTVALSTQLISYGATLAWIIIATVWGHHRFKLQQQILLDNIGRVESMIERMKES